MGYDLRKWVRKSFNDFALVWSVTRFESHIWLNVGSFWMMFHSLLIFWEKVWPSVECGVTRNYSLMIWVCVE